VSGITPKNSLQTVRRWQTTSVRLSLNEANENGSD
jgi:hypothetical protein